MKGEAPIDRILDIVYRLNHDGNWWSGGNQYSSEPSVNGLDCHQIVRPSGVAQTILREETVVGSSSVVSN